MKFPKKQLTHNYLRNFLRKVEPHNDKYLAEFTSLQYPTYVNNKKRGDKNAQAKENEKIIAAIYRRITGDENRKADTGEAEGNNKGL